MAEYESDSFFRAAAAVAAPPADLLGRLRSNWCVLDDAETFWVHFEETKFLVETMPQHTPLFLRAASP